MSAATAPDDKADAEVVLKCDVSLSLRCSPNLLFVIEYMMGLPETIICHRGYHLPEPIEFLKKIIEVMYMFEQSLQQPINGGVKLKRSLMNYVYKYNVRNTTEV